MLDHLIKGGTVVDGTGSAPRLADVGIRDGRVVAVGDVTEEATNVVDAAGKLVLPGVIDPHTHYDAQLFWDGGASPSNVHGVTTIIGGNCGFTLAPLQADDAQYTAEMLAAVEGMSVTALREGVPWNWETFGEYLDRLDGSIGVNAAFLVGHCALRRYVMGADSVGNEASPEQVAEMQRVLGSPSTPAVSGSPPPSAAPTAMGMASRSRPGGRPPRRSSRCARSWGRGPGPPSRP